jgi:hypothetical protein
MTVELLDKLVEVARSSAVPIGGFRLFALIRQPDESGSWDVMISADSITPHNRARMMGIVASEIQNRLTLQDLWEIRRVAVADKNLPVVEYLTAHCSGERLPREFGPITVHGEVFVGYIIVANRITEMQDLHRDYITLNVDPSTTATSWHTFSTGHHRSHS